MLSTSMVHFILKQNAHDNINTKEREREREKRGETDRQTEGDIVSLKSEFKCFLFLYSKICYCHMDQDFMNTASLSQTGMPVYL